MLSYITAEPHGLDQDNSKHNRDNTLKNCNILYKVYNDSYRNSSRPIYTHTHTHTHLSLLDGLCSSFLEQLDWLVVVQCVVTPHHVAQKLHAVELPIGVLRPGVVHQADLQKPVK